MPRARTAEPAPSSERPTLRVERNIMQEHVAAADALAEIHRYLEDARYLESGARNEALVSAAILRANAIRRSLEQKPIDPNRAWEIIHELNAYAYDLEDAIEHTPSDQDLEHALTVVQATLSVLRPLTSNMPEHVAVENPEADDVGYSLWEDAREARQSVAEGTMTREDASRLKTLFIERAQRLEDDEKLLEEAAQDSGMRLHPQKQISMVRAIRELHDAISDLGRLELGHIIDVTDDAKVVVKSEKEMQKEGREKEKAKLIRQQEKLEPHVKLKYGESAQDLYEAGGPSGFLHGLRSLLSSEEDEAQDPYFKWKALEDRRQALEAFDPTENLPIPLMQKKEKKKKRAA